MIVNASSKRLTRWSNGNPKARYSSSFHPAPSPRISRPPLSSWTAAALAASIAGLWKLVAATSGPSWTRVVIAAIAASWLHASHGPTGSASRSRYRRWSPTQIESRPMPSAVSIIARSSGQRTTRSTSGS